MGAGRPGGKYERGEAAIRRPSEGRGECKADRRARHATEDEGDDALVW